MRNVIFGAQKRCFILFIFFPAGAMVKEMFVTNVTLFIFNYLERYKIVTKRYKHPNFVTN